MWKDLSRVIEVLVFFNIHVNTSLQKRDGLLLVLKFICGLLLITQDEELARQLVELGYRGSGEVREIYLSNFLWSVTSNW